MEKLKIGFIGCGQIARTRHIRELSMNKNVEMAAFCDIIPERAQEMAGKFCGKAYTDYHDVLVREDIDAVFVCCCNRDHAQISIDALNAGKHVMCEKPMATTVEDCQRMIHAAKANNKTLMVGHNQRLLPAHRKAKEILESGQYGKVITFRTTFGHKGCEHFSYGGLNTWFFRKEPSGFGTSADLGVHKADLIRYLLNEEITEVSAFTGTLAKRYESGELIEVEDNAICLLKTENGILGSLTASWTYNSAEDNSTTLYMEGGIMKIFDDPDHDIVIYENDGGTKYYKLGGIQTNDNQTYSGIPDEFVTSILEKRKPCILPQDGMKAVKIILSCLKSAEIGQVVRV